MAKVTSQQSKYLLHIRGKQDFSLAFGQRTRLEGEADKIKGNEYSLLLTSLHVCKEMYKPGVIEADVQIIKTKYSASSAQVCAGPDDAALFDNLLGARVDLTDQDYEKEGYDYDENMAKDYILFNYEPRFENVGGVTGFYVKLYAYSPDKMLTLRRYSACYTGKVLGEDILIDIVDSDKNAIVTTTNTTTSTTTSSTSSSTSGSDKGEEKTTKTPFISALQLDLHQLSYTSNNVTFELIQPYLVQQDETEHEFISRIANRCGEFFFYENGALHLGCVPLKDAAGKAVAAKQIGIFRQLTMPGQYSYDDNVPAWISDYMRDDVAITEKDKTKKEQMNTNRNERNGQNADVSAQYYGPATDQVNTYTYDDKSGFDDFRERLGKNTASDIIDGYTLDKFSFWVSRLKGILAKDTLSAALSSVFYDIGEKSIRNGIQAAYWKDKYKEKHLDKLKYSEMSNHADSKTTVSPYSNYAYALDGKFYSTMAQLEKESAKTVIRVVMEAENVRPQFLGSTFLLNSASTEEYAIVKVTYDARQEADGATRTYSCVVEAVKKVQPSLSGTKPLVYANQEAFVGKSKMAYENMATNMQYLPLPLPNATRGKARPQAAIVKDVSDPSDLNRVRIKYPWQKKVDEKSKPAAPKCIQIQSEVISKRRIERFEQSMKNVDNLSPWIRVAAPMAGKGYGVKFLPRVDDEVMVDYENGDMERPFVVGSLYSQRTGGTTATTSITSPAGDVVQFLEASPTPYAFKSFVPFLKAVQFVCPELECDSLKDSSFSGGIVMQDKNLLNKIMLSTPSRTISIASSIGNVTIDAFKGISIKAPFGKVSIEGKDVEIKASNKLTLESGGNIKKTKFLSKKDFGKNMVSDLGENLGKDLKATLECYDVELLRCLWDAFLRPVDGTLKIHSGRYLCLEGGPNTAALPQSMEHDEYRRHTDIQRTLKFAKSKVSVCEEAAQFLQERKKVFAVTKRLLLECIDLANADGVNLENTVVFKRGNDGMSKDDFKSFFNNEDFEYGKLFQKYEDYNAFNTYIDEFKVEGNVQVPQVLQYVSYFGTLVFDIKQIMRSAYEKKKKITDFFTSIGNLQPAALKNVDFTKYQGEGNITFDAVKNALVAYTRRLNEDNIFNPAADVFGEYDEQAKALLKKERHKLYYQIIKLWHEYIEYGVDPNAPNYIDDDVDTVTENDESWKTYLSGLQYKEPAEAAETEGGIKNFTSGFMKGFKYPLDFYTDDLWKRSKAFCKPQFIWNPESKGGVLIAGHDGKTCEIVGPSIKVNHNQEDLNYIETVLD